MVLRSYLASANMQKISLPRNAEHQFCESIKRESVTLLIARSSHLSLPPSARCLQRNLSREACFRLQQCTLWSAELFSILHSQFAIRNSVAHQQRQNRFTGRRPRSQQPCPKHDRTACS